MFSDSELKEFRKG